MKIEINGQPVFEGKWWQLIILIVGIMTCFSTGHMIGDFIWSLFNPCV